MHIQVKAWHHCITHEREWAASLILYTDSLHVLRVLCYGVPFVGKKYDDQDLDLVPAVTEDALIDVIPLN